MVEGFMEPPEIHIGQEKRRKTPVEQQLHGSVPVGPDSFPASEVPCVVPDKTLQPQSPPSYESPPPNLFESPTSYESPPSKESPLPESEFPKKKRPAPEPGSFDR